MGTTWTLKVEATAIGSSSLHLKIPSWMLIWQILKGLLLRAQYFREMMGMAPVVGWFMLPLKI